MIARALAALALGSSLLILTPGDFQTGEASQFKTISTEIIERCEVYRVDGRSENE